MNCAWQSENALTSRNLFNPGGFAAILRRYFSPGVFIFFHKNLQIEAEGKGAGR
jgi:hypothetical protein